MTQDIALICLETLNGILDLYELPTLEIGSDIHSRIAWYIKRNSPKPVRPIGRPPHERTKQELDAQNRAEVRKRNRVAERTQAAKRAEERQHSRDIEKRNAARANVAHCEAFLCEYRFIISRSRFAEPVGYDRTGRLHVRYRDNGLWTDPIPFKGRLCPLSYEPEFSREPRTSLITLRANYKLLTAAEFFSEFGRTPEEIA